MEREQRFTDRGDALPRQGGRLGTECRIRQLDDVALGILERIRGPADRPALNVMTAVDRDPEEPRPDGLAAKDRDPDVRAKERLLNDVSGVGRCAGES